MNAAKKLEKLDQLIAAGRAGKKPLGLYLTSDSPVAIEIAAAVGVDWLMITREHSAIEDRTLLYHMIRAAEVWELPTFIKLGSHDMSEAEQVLDMGACGVAFPHVENAEQLRRLVKGCRLQPAGTRGYCSVNRALDWGTSYVTGQFAKNESYYQLQERALVLPFVESQEGLDNLDEMLDVEDVPLFFVGSSDLSMALSTDGRPNPQAVLEAEATAAAKIRAKGRMVSMYTHSIAFRRPDGLGDIEECRERFRERTDFPFTTDAWALGQALYDCVQRRNESIKDTE